MSLSRVTRDPVTRGCGNRKAGGVYACCGLSEHGLPIENFLIDPVQSLDVQCFRAPIVLADPTEPGLNHMAIWIGAEYYPSPWDYIEETRRLGASRRIPADFDFSALTPGKSRMVLIHPLAFTKRIDLPDACPKDLLEQGHGIEVACLGAARHYSESHGSKRNEAGDTEDGIGITVGQVVYQVPRRQIAVERGEFSPGAFLQLPLTHFEYQAKDDQDEPPTPFVERVEQTGFAAAVVQDNGPSSSAFSDADEGEL